MPPKGRGGRTRNLLEKVKKKVHAFVAPSGSANVIDDGITNASSPSGSSLPSGCSTPPAPPAPLSDPTPDTPEPDPHPPVNWALHSLKARARRPALDIDTMHYGQYATSYRMRKPRLKGPEEHWVLREVVPVDAIPMWFECELQDFAKGKSEVASCVEQHWFTPPGRTPDDWRARNFCFTWKADVTEAQRALAIASDAVVATVSYPCKGHHRRPQGLKRKKEMEEKAKAARDKRKAMKEVELETNSEAGGGSVVQDSARDGRSQSLGAGSTADGDVDDDEDDDDAPNDPLRWHQCKDGPEDNVVIVLEVRAKNLAMAEVWQLNEHDDIDVVEQWLDYSKQMKNYAEVIFTQFTGLTHSQTAHVIAKNLIPRFQMNVRHGDQVPIFRHISEEQVRNLTTAARRRRIGIKNVALAIESIVYAVPSQIFGYKPLSETDERTEAEFTFGIKDDFSVDTWILYSAFTGGFIDSTWRGMNQAHCPVYLIGTATDFGDSPHFAPTAVVYSEGSSYLIVRTFLKAFVAAVLYRCAEICAGTANSVYSRPEEQSVLLAVAQEWQRLGRVLPAFFMTDMDQAQIKALKHCFPTVPIRICQFHLVQAIFRWQTRHGKRMNGPNLPKTIRLRIIIAFNRLQRCRTMESWPEMVGAFYVEVDAIIDSATDEDEPDDLSEDAAPLDPSTVDATPVNPQSVDGAPVTPPATNQTSSIQVNKEGGQYVPDAQPAPSVDAQSSQAGAAAKKKNKRFKLTKAQRESWKKDVHLYFDEWVFKDPTWIPMFTDMGMPEGQTREQTWNTNNWIEAAIRIFGQTFLDCRKNKRVDRLLWIIIKDYLPFYRTWRSSPKFQSCPDPPKELQDLFAQAHQLWADGSVEQLGENLFRVVYETKDPAGTIRQINFTVDTLKIDCKCDSFTRNGKLCVHIQAAELYRCIGSAREVELEETRAITQAKFFREKKIMALERRIRPRGQFTNQASDGSIFFPTDNPLKKDLDPEDYDLNYDDRPSGKRYRRNKFLCDQRVSERVHSVCAAVSKLPGTITRPGPNHPSLTPMAPWRAKGANVELLTMDTLRALRERGGLEFSASAPSSQLPIPTKEPTPQGNAPFVAPPTLTPEVVPGSFVPPSSTRTDHPSMDVRPRPSNTIPSSSVPTPGLVQPVRVSTPQEITPPSVVAPSPSASVLPSPSPTPSPLAAPPAPSAKVSTIEVVSPLPLPSFVVSSTQALPPKVTPPSSTLASSLLATPPNSDRSPRPLSPITPPSPSAARIPFDCASEPLSWPSTPTSDPTTTSPTPQLPISVQATQTSPHTPLPARSITPHVPSSPLALLQGLNQDACACHAPGSEGDRATENIYDPALPRAEADSGTGDPNTPFDSVHGVHTIDRRRWRTGALMLSIEMAWFVRLLNSLSATLGRGIVFLHIATGSLEILSRLDWSIDWDSATAETELEDLYNSNGGASQFTRLIRLMRSMRPNKVVFMHLENGHWTSFVHDLQTRTVTCIQTLDYTIC